MHKAIKGSLLKRLSRIMRLRLYGNKVAIRQFWTAAKCERKFFPISALPRAVMKNQCRVSFTKRFLKKCLRGPQFRRSYAVFIYFHLKLKLTIFFFPKCNIFRKLIHGRMKWL